jgi:hypothetical protein
MKRIFLLKTLFLLLFIVIQFYPMNCLLANQKTYPVLTVLPGKTVSQQLILSGRKTEVVNFIVNTAGKMEIKAEWTGNAKTLIFILYKPGYIQAVRKEGRSPITIEYNVTPDMISRDNTWRVSLANFSSKTSATGSISIFREGLSKPESAIQIDEETKIKNYQLMEKPEKDLAETGSEKDVLKDEKEGQGEKEEESTDEAIDEKDLKLIKTRINNLRNTSRIFKELAMEPVSDSLNQEEKEEAEKYNKWLLDTSEEMSILGDKWEEKLDNTMDKTEDKQDMNKEFSEQYLELIQKMQSENRQFTLMSNIMKNKHDTAKNSINNIR